MIWIQQFSYYFVKSILKIIIMLIKSVKILSEAMTCSSWQPNNSRLIKNKKLSVPRYLGFKNTFECSQSKDKIFNIQQQNQLFSIDKYSFRFLTPKDSKSAHQILSNTFQQAQPLTNSFYKRFPNRKTQAKQLWTAFWSLWMHQATTNNLSIGVFYKQSNKMIATCIAQDFTYSPVDLQRIIMSNFNSIKCAIQVENQLIKKVNPQLNLEELFLKKDTVLNIWAAGVEKEHQRNGLLCKMIQANQMLGRAKGFKFSFIYGTNFKSNKTATKMSYQHLASTDSKIFQVQNIKPFELIQEQNRFSSIWLKNL